MGVEMKNLNIPKVVIVNEMASGGSSYRNEVLSTFEAAGWGLSGSGGGCQWLTREFEDGMGGGIMAITDEGGLDHPVLWSEPCILGIYDQDGESMDIIIRASAEVLFWFVTALLFKEEPAINS